MQHIQKQVGGALDLGTGHSPLTHYWIQLLSFHILAYSLARAKTQLICFQPIPRSLTENTQGGSIRLSRTDSAKGNIMARFWLVLAPLLRSLLTSRNGNALPAAMGAAAKRAHRLQERRSCLALN